MKGWCCISRIQSNIAISVTVVHYQLDKTILVETIIINICTLNLQKRHLRELIFVGPTSKQHSGKDEGYF